MFLCITGSSSSASWISIPWFLMSRFLWILAIMKRAPYAEYWFRANTVFQWTFPQPFKTQPHNWCCNWVFKMLFHNFIKSAASQWWTMYSKASCTLNQWQRRTQIMWGNNKDHHIARRPNTCILISKLWKQTKYSQAMGGMGLHLHREEMEQNHLQECALVHPLWLASSISPPPPNPASTSWKRVICLGVYLSHYIRRTLIPPPWNLEN